MTLNDPGGRSDQGRLGQGCDLLGLWVLGFSFGMFPLILTGFRV